MFEIALFAGFQVRVDGKIIRGFRSNSARALLAYLCLEDGRLHSRDALATLLRSDTSDTQARQSLRTTLHRLRKALDQAIPNSSERLMVIGRKSLDWQHSPDLLQIDAERFTHTLRHIKTASLTELNAAADLYTGEFLKGIHLAESTAFDEWLLLRREQFKQQAMLLFDAVGERLCKQADWSRVMATAQRQLAIEPWHEAAYQRWIQALVAMGERAYALAVYERCVLALQDGLGVSPADKTAALVEHLRDPVVAPHNLPALPTALIGRKSELKQIAALLQSPTCRLLTLLGMGGIGKTHLALAAAHESGAANWQAIFYVTLDPQQQINSQEALATAIVDQLQSHIDRAGKRTPIKHLINFLHKTDTLLILDNFERALDAVMLLPKLLADRLGLTILVTSRRMLQLRAEHLFEVPPLALPVNAEIASFKHNAADLFVQKARLHRHDFVPTAAERSAIVALCERTGGLPLALEMAAAQIRRLSVQKISESVAESAEFLRSPFRDTPIRQRSVAAVFDSSWVLLSAEEQAVFPILSVFRGGFSAEAACTIAGTDLQLLDQLANQSLLTWNQSSHRYFIHPLLREFAQAHLDADTTAYQEHSHYFYSFLQAQVLLFDEVDVMDAVQRIEHEYSNVVGAWEWALSNGRSDVLLPFARLLRSFHSVAQRQYEATQLFGRALTSLPESQKETPLHCTYLTVLSRVQTELGTLAVANLSAQEALSVALQSGDRALVAQSRQALAAVFIYKGDYTAAEGELMLARSQSDDASRSAVLCDARLALIQFLRANYQQAQHLYKSCLTWYERAEASYPRQRALILNGLGNVAYTIGQIEQSRRYFEESIALRQAVENSKTIGEVALGNLGEVALAQQRFDDAQGYFERALIMARSGKNRFRESHILLCFSYHRSGLGADGEARNFAEESLDIMTSLERRGWIAMRYAQLAMVWLRLGDLDKALSFSEQAVAVAEKQGEKYPLAVSLTIRGDVRMAREEWSLSAETHTAARDLRLGLGMHTYAMENHAGLAAIALAQAQPKLASQHVAQILAHLEQGTLDGTYNRYQIYQRCHQVLDAVDLDSAEFILSQAQADMQRATASIHDSSERRLFLAHANALSS